MRKSAWLFTFLLSVTLAIIIPRYAPGRGELDFIKYWSASRLLILRMNPFDSEALRQMQMSARPELDLKQGDIFETWNPPWLLLLLGPLSALPFDLAVQAWVVINTFLILLSLLIAWKLAGGNPYDVEFIIVLAAGFLFGGTLTLIRMGQISVIALISLTAGLWYLQKRQDLPAGIFLFFASIKPHLSFLILLVIFLWAIRGRRFSIFLGMVLVGIASVVMVWIIYPDWLSAYLNRLDNMPYQEIYTSTFGSLVALIFGFDYFKYIGLLLLPLIMPLAKRFNSSPMEMTNLALVVTLPFAPYGFSFDQILLLPAITQMLFWITNKELRSSKSRLVVLGLTIIYLFYYWLMSLRDLPYSWFFLVSFALMILFLLCRSSRFEHTRFA